MKKIKDYIKLIRVKHYLKNFLILFPLFFSKNILNTELLKKSILAFFAFSFAASVIYVLNDIHDYENDKIHPTKCKRPIASGRVSKLEAYSLIVGCASLTILLNECLIINFGRFEENNWYLRGLILIYIIINILYSMCGFKDYALWDIAILTLGYVIRIYYGAVAIGVQVSSWMALTAIFMATFLGLGKRRNEIKMQGDKSRKVLMKYSIGFLDKNMYVCLGLTIASYTLWCKEMVSQSNNLNYILSVFLALLICMRYSMILERNSEGDPISVLLDDVGLVALVILWCVIMFFTLY